MPKARATLEETYNYIISSLKTAESVMSEEMPSDRNNDNHKYASIYSVWALLSRVYLYKNELDSCILYSDMLINSGIYTLEAPESFPDYFANAKTGTESIWIIPYNLVDDQLNGSVASMIYNGNNCWAEEGASVSIIQDMGIGTTMEDIDQRWKYIATKALLLKTALICTISASFPDRMDHRHLALLYFEPG